MLASTIITGNITAVPNWRTNNPVIIRPTDNQVFELGNISVSWHAIIGVNYFITLFDMTGDVFSVETVIARTELGTLNGFTINSRHLLPGRRYSLRLEAVSSNSTPGVSGVNFSVRGESDHVSSAPSEFFVTQPTQNLATRTDEVSHFNHSRASNNANYQSDLRQAGSLSQLHQAIYTGPYVLPFLLGDRNRPNYPQSNLSQGFWGLYSHAGRAGANHNGRGAIDIGTVRNEGWALYSMLDGEVISIIMDTIGGSRIDISSNINGINYIIRYLHVDHRNQHPTPASLGIQVGHRIQRGARIGTVGGEPRWRTHIHIEVIRDGIRFDPLRFFDLEKKYNVSYTLHD